MAEAVSYLKEEGGSSLSHRFLDEVEATFSRLCSFPHIGVVWPTDNPAIQGLRRRPLPRFPYSVFYLPTKTTIEVVRVLHNSRFLPPLLEGQ